MSVQSRGLLPWRAVNLFSDHVPWSWLPVIPCGRSPYPAFVSYFEVALRQLFSERDRRDIAAGPRRKSICAFVLAGSPVELLKSTGLPFSPLFTSFKDFT